MRCSGCGVELQHEDPEELGYLPESVLESRLQAGKEIMCRRCFLIKHYSSLPENDSVSHTLDNLNEYLKLAREVIYVIDISDFDGTYRKDISQLLKNHSVHYVLNKIDLLPKEVKVEEIREWASDIIKEPVSRVRPVSVLGKYGLNSLYAYLKSAAEEFVSIGVTNVGKSSLLNGLMRSEEIIVSRFPGTTVEVASKTLKNSAVIVYDTPGIFTNDRLTDLMSTEDQSRLLARKRLKKSTFQFHDVRTVFLGGFVKIDAKNQSDPVGIFHTFVPESVSVHETNPNTAAKEWDSWFGDILRPPFDRSKRGKYRWEAKEFRLRTGQELHICGLGWINVAKGPLTIGLTRPKNVALKVRKGLVGPKKFKKNR